MLSAPETQIVTRQRGRSRAYTDCWRQRRVQRKVKDCLERILSSSFPRAQHRGRKGPQPLMWKERSCLEEYFTLSISTQTHARSWAPEVTCLELTHTLTTSPSPAAASSALGLGGCSPGPGGTSHLPQPITQVTPMQLCSEAADRLQRTTSELLTRYYGLSSVCPCAAAHGYYCCHAQTQLEIRTTPLQCHKL